MYKLVLPETPYYRVLAWGLFSSLFYFGTLTIGLPAGLILWTHRSGASGITPWTDAFLLGGLHSAIVVGLICLVLTALELVLIEKAYTSYGEAESYPLNLSGRFLLAGRSFTSALLPALILWGVLLWAPWPYWLGLGFAISLSWSRRLWLEFWPFSLPVHIEIAEPPRRQVIALCAYLLFMLCLGPFAVRWLMPVQREGHALSIKTNMHSFQTIIETYGVEQQQYPENVAELKLKASQTRAGMAYWKELHNPYTLDAELEAYVDFDAFVPKDMPLEHFPPGSPHRQHPGVFQLPPARLDYAGRVVYRRLDPTHYVLYGTQRDGRFLREKGQIFVLKAELLNAE